MFAEISLNVLFLHQRMRAGKVIFLLGLRHDCVISHKNGSMEGVILEVNRRRDPGVKCECILPKF